MKKEKETTWHRLDNTANIYPVISSDRLSGVYRIAVILREEIDPDILQKAVNLTLGWFDGFRVRLRRGVFWYYYETNKKELRVKEEYTYPCRYIDPYRNNQYPLRVSFCRNKINLEVFHALTDGYGAVNFMRELTAQYLRLTHPDALGVREASPLEDTSFSLEDAYLKYYKKQGAKGYGKTRAFALKGSMQDSSVTGVVHEKLEIGSLKRAAKKNQASITQYLTAVLIEAIYREYWVKKPAANKIRINVPVNLRQFFPSRTTLNFFGVLFAEFDAQAEGGEADFQKILSSVRESFERQLNPEHMAEVISYNVSNEKNPFARLAPLFIKNLGIRLIYNRSAKAFTTTLSNVGQFRMPEEFEPYIENVHFIMGVSEKQPLKCVACSYQNTLTLTISSVFRDCRLADAVEKRLLEDGVEVSREENGVYGEKKAEYYPDISFDPKKYHFMLRFLIMLSIIVGALLIEINLLTSHEIWWSLISSGAIVYFWVTMLFSIRHHTNPAAKILVQMLGAMALCVLADFSTGYRGWSVNYAVPGMILAADLATLALMLAHFRSWQSYLLFQIEYAVFSLIPLLLYFLGVVTRPLLALLAIGGSWILLLVTVLFGRKKAKTELKRRFHI